MWCFYRKWEYPNIILCHSFQMVKMTVLEWSVIAPIQMIYWKDTERVQKVKIINPWQIFPQFLRFHIQPENIINDSRAPLWFTSIIASASKLSHTQSRFDVQCSEQSTLFSHTFRWSIDQINHLFHSDLVVVRVFGKVDLIEATIFASSSVVSAENVDGNKKRSESSLDSLHEWEENQNIHECSNVLKLQFALWMRTPCIHHSYTGTHISSYSVEPAHDFRPGQLDNYPQFTILDVFFKCCVKMLSKID